MINTRKYLVASTTLSLLFHLLLFTFANKLPAFQQNEADLKLPPKRKPVKLRSYKVQDYGKSPSRLKSQLKIKSTPEQLSAALKAIQPTLNTPELTPQKVNVAHAKLAKPLTDSAKPIEPVQKLPESFYHIEIKSPTKTNQNLSGKSLTSSKLKLKAPATQLKGSNLTATGNQITSAPQVGIRRTIPKISIPKIKFHKPKKIPSSRKISTPTQKTLPREITKDVPGQMEHFLNISPSVYVDNIDQRGYFKLTLDINENASGLNPIDKDTYFIIDSSRSITRKQLSQFIYGCLDGFKTLSSNDRFNPVIFTTSAKKGFPNFKKVSPESIKEARNFLSFIRMIGGQTDIYNSIKPFVNGTSRENNRPQQIFLMTDGVSTTEQSLENSEMIKEITRGNNADISIFGFATGKHTNSFLVDFLTYRNRGDSLIIEEIDDSSKALANYIDERSEIIVTDLNHRYNGVRGNEVFPKKLPHLYRNRTLTVYGTFELNEESAMMQILGQSSTGPRQLIYKINFAEARQASPELAKTWAAQKIFHLIGQLTDNPDQNILNEIYSLQRKFKVYIPYSLPKAK